MIPFHDSDTIVTFHWWPGALLSIDIPVNSRRKNDNVTNSVFKDFQKFVTQIGVSRLAARGTLRSEKKCNLIFLSQTTNSWPVFSHVGQFNYPYEHISLSFRLERCHKPQMSHSREKRHRVELKCKVTADGACNHDSDMTVFIQRSTFNSERPNLCTICKACSHRMHQNSRPVTDCEAAALGELGSRHLSGWLASVW